MATFARGHHAYTTHQKNSDIIRKISGTPTTPGTLLAHTAADHITLRGIPALGPGVGGAINGTRPDLTVDYVRPHG